MLVSISENEIPLRQCSILGRNRSTELYNQIIVLVGFDFHNLRFNVRTSVLLVRVTSTALIIVLN